MTKDATEQIPTRRCKKCPRGVVKPLTPEYFPRTTNPSGFSYWCRECNNKRRRELWAERQKDQTRTGTYIRQARALARQRATERANVSKLPNGTSRANYIDELLVEEFAPALRHILVEQGIQTKDVWQPVPGKTVYIKDKKVRIKGYTEADSPLFQRYCVNKDREEWIEVLDKNKNLRAFPLDRLVED